jgi:hypothetical protein
LQAASFSGAQSESAAPRSTSSIACRVSVNGNAQFDRSLRIALRGHDPSPGA